MITASEALKTTEEKRPDYVKAILAHYSVEFQLAIEDACSHGQTNFIYHMPNRDIVPELIKMVKDLGYKIIELDGKVSVYWSKIE